MTTANPLTTGTGGTLWTLEAWRGVAAWLVVYAHFHGTAGLDLPLLTLAHTGVDLFFVVSGVVFAPYFFGRRMDLGGFFVRRVFRLYPAFLAALAVYVGLAALRGEPTPYLLAHLTFTYTFTLTPEVVFTYNPAFWSLPTEVEYYLALPLLAVLVRGSVLRLLGLTAVALGLRAVIGPLATPGGGLLFAMVHHLPGMLIEFLMGVCVALVAPHLRTLAARGGVFAAGLVLWLALAAAFTVLGDEGVRAGWLWGHVSWIAALAFAAMVAATVVPPRVAPVPVIAGALWAGRLSYATYLLHNAARDALLPWVPMLGGGVSMVLACVLTLAASWLLYIAWEDPWRRLGRRLGRRLARPMVEPPPADGAARP